MEKEGFMIRTAGRQSSFMDTDYLCDSLVPQDDFYRKFKEAVTPLLKDEDFAEMYCMDNGRPGISPVKMACAVILQYYRNYSDRQMEDACAWDIRIKHALGIEVDGKLFDHSTLGKFRKRLLKHGKEKQVFDMIVKHLVDTGLIKKDEMQRIDATHIAADIAVPTAIRLIRKCIYEILKMLEKKDKDVYDRVAEAIDIGDYDKKKINKEIPWKPEEKSFKKALFKVATEAKAVLGIVSGLDLGGTFAFAVDMLKDALEENIAEEEDGKVSVLDKRPADCLVSPIDPDARFGVKSKTKKFCGYKANITETVESRFITNISATRGNVYDGEEMINLVSGQKKDYGLSPVKLIGDAAYGSGENRRIAGKCGIQIVAPVVNKAHENGELYPKSMFKYDEEKGIVTCPKGEKTYKSTYDSIRDYKVFYFPMQVCEACDCQDKCTKHAKGYRTITMTKYEKEISEAEKYNKKKRYKKEMKLRPMIENTNSDAKRHHGLRRAKYHGAAKTSLQCYFTGAVINLKRWINGMLEKVKPKKKRLAWVT